MTKYHIEFSPKAERFLQKTKDIIVLKRIFLKLELLEKNPRPEDVKALKGSNYFRVRVGDYRIIYEIDYEKYCIFVFSIGHRRDIYKKYFQ